MSGYDSFAQNISKSFRIIVPIPSSNDELNKNACIIIFINHLYCIKIVRELVHSICTSFNH